MEATAHRYDEVDFGVFGDLDPLALRFDLPFDQFEDGPLKDDETPVDSLPTSYAGRLDRFLDDVSEEEAALARQAASRARAVERARAWAVVSDEFVLADARLSESERESWVMRVFVSEVATRLRLPEQTAGRLIDESRVLVHELPKTLDALALAKISYRHAVVIIEQARTLPAHVRTSFESSVLPDAERLPVTQFRRRAVSERERVHPDSIEDRKRSAVTDRRFAFEAEVDGMAWLHHLLPAPHALAIHTRVTDIAQSLQGEGEQRTLAQLRSDVAADLLLDGVPRDVFGGDAESRATSPTKSKKKRAQAFGIRPRVVITVPALTAFGLSDEPGVLDGYGLIDPETARRLAALAPSWIRLFTDPVTGAVLELGKKRYTVPKDLRTWLELRDQTCRFPGCGRAATRSDVDHTDGWATGGSTDVGNLACLCEPHHLMKHTTSWRVVQRGNGVLDWRSPTGQVYTTRPALEIQGTSPPATEVPGAPTDAEPADPPF